MRKHEIKWVRNPVLALADVLSHSIPYLVLQICHNARNILRQINLDSVHKRFIDAYPCILAKKACSDLLLKGKHGLRECFDLIEEFSWHDSRGVVGCGDCEQSVFVLGFMSIVSSSYSILLL